MVISKNAVTSTTVYTVYTTIKPLVNADSPQVWESPHAELKKSLYLLLTIAELIWESGGTCFCVKRRVIGTHSHERSWMLRGGNTLLSLAVIPSSSLTGSVSLCSGVLSPCLLKPKNNPHSSAQQQLKSSYQSLFCSAHCRWLYFNKLRVHFWESCVWGIFIHRSEFLLPPSYLYTESIQV